MQDTGQGQTLKSIEQPKAWAAQQPWVPSDCKLRLTGLVAGMQVPGQEPDVARGLLAQRWAPAQAQGLALGRRSTPLWQEEEHNRASYCCFLFPETLRMRKRDSRSVLSDIWQSQSSSHSIGACMAYSAFNLARGAPQFVLEAPASRYTKWMGRTADPTRPQVPLCLINSGDGESLITAQCQPTGRGLCRNALPDNLPGPSLN